MQLALDAGNSSVKFGLFKNKDLILSGKLKKDESIKNYISKLDFLQIKSIVSCSVLKDFNLKDLPEVKHISISIHSKFPFPILYNSPETLGIDRVVACVGAWNGNEDLLVIDAGSCMTFDYVSLKHGYEGGAISPGLQMRFAAMNNFTEKLPLVSKFENNPKILGSTTTECLQSGAINGIKFEIEGFISHFKHKSPNLKVFLTGGDSIFLGTELKSGIFADQNLVLKGLNSLIHLNDA